MSSLSPTSTTFQNHRTTSAGGPYTLVWLGLRQTSAGVWAWPDGTTYNHGTDWANWNSGQPGSETCVVSDAALGEIETEGWFASALLESCLFV